MVIKAIEGRVWKDGKSVQLVIVTGAGSSRKSVTVHAKNSATGLFGPNPFHSKEDIEKRHRDAQATIDFLLVELADARKRERNMLFLASERRPWLNLSKDEQKLAASTWHEFAVKETEEASRRLDIAYDEMNKVEENFPLVVKFECEKIFTAGKKPSQDKKRAA